MNAPSVLADGETHRIIVNDGEFVGICGRRQGYLAVPPGHAWFGMDTDEQEGWVDATDYPEVHGGCTFAKLGRDCDFSVFIPADHWVIGWDYMHFCGEGDWVAGLSYGVKPTFEIILNEILATIAMARTVTKVPGAIPLTDYPHDEEDVKAPERDANDNSATQEQRDANETLLIGLQFSALFEKGGATQEQRDESNNNSATQEQRDANDNSATQEQRDANDNSATQEQRDANETLLIGLQISALFEKGGVSTTDLEKVFDMLTVFRQDIVARERMAYGEKIYKLEEQLSDALDAMSQSNELVNHLAALLQK
jgi:hypothetical protein